MSGYSDGFSYLTNEAVMKRGFASINDVNSIVTPDEKNYSNDDNSTKNQPKTKLDNDYESFMNRRKHDVPSTPPRM